MTEAKKTTKKKTVSKTETSKPKTARARAPRRKANPDRVVLMKTHVGVPLMMRANPTVEEVRGFVAEHNRRYEAGEPGGPSGIPAFNILGATYYESESDADADIGGTPIDL